MRSRFLVLLAVAITLLVLAPPSFALQSRSLTLTVYSDGYVSVVQILAVDPKATSVQVPLVSSAVSNLVATDQNGTPLSYGFSPSSSNLTVYTLGAVAVTLTYETDSLTSKNGTVWTLTFDAMYNSTVVLPKASSLVSVSGSPYSLNQTDQAPEMRLYPGTWKVSYGVSLGPLTSTTQNTTTTHTPGGGIALGGTYDPLLEVGTLVAAVGLGLYFLWWRRRGIGPVSGDLRPDDLQVLNFIQEIGGKVLEPEIRMRFALPKTSAWRQIKRLERLGYVKVTKIGSQNQIELLKERSPGA